MPPFRLWPTPLTSWSAWSNCQVFISTDPRLSSVLFSQYQFLYAACLSWLPWQTMIHAFYCAEKPKTRISVIFPLKHYVLCKILQVGQAVVGTNKCIFKLVCRVFDRLRNRCSWGCQLQLTRLVVQFVVDLTGMKKRLKLLFPVGRHGGNVHRKKNG